MSKASPVANRKTRSAIQQKPSLSKTAGETFDLIGTTTRYRRTERLFTEGEPAKYLYRLESGCIKTYNLLKDDRRHICAFYLPGDCVGLEAQKTFDCSADATAPSVVRVIDKKTLMAHANADVGLLKYLLDATALELRRTRDHKALLLKSAQNRVVDFLLETAGRGLTKAALSCR